MSFKGSVLDKILNYMLKGKLCEHKSAWWKPCGCWLFNIIHFKGLAVLVWFIHGDCWLPVDL